MTAPPTLLEPGAYGADAHGLLFGWITRRDGSAREAENAQAGQAALEDPETAWVWLHVNLSHRAALPWLRELGGLSDDFFEALDSGSRATRIERDGACLFAVINDLAWDFEFEVSDVSTLWLHVSERRVVSARRQPLRSVDRLRLQCRRGEQPGSSVGLLEQLLRDQADELQRIVRRAAERVDDIEDQLLSGRLPTQSADLARLRRVFVRLQRLLAPEPAALQRLLMHPPDWVTEAEVEALRGASEEFAWVLRDIGTLHERAKLMQDESAGRVAEQTGRSLFTLTMVTVLALPINLLAGLMGMNVGGIPFAENRAGFWIMVALIAAITGALAWVVTRRLRPTRD